MYRYTIAAIDNHLKNKQYVAVWQLAQQARIDEVMSQLSRGIRRAIISAVLGVTVRRVMPDKVSCCWSRTFANASRKLGLKHMRTNSCRPKTDGKAERFILTSCPKSTPAPTTHRGTSLRTAQVLHRSITPDAVLIAVPDQAAN